MKFLNYLKHNRINCGIFCGSDRILDLTNVLQFLGKDITMGDSDTHFFNNYFALKPLLDDLLRNIPKELQAIPISEVKILAPALNPSKIICLGLNYRDHAAESGEKLPKLPMLFSKAPSAIIGLDDEIKIPKVRKKITGSSIPINFLDYEVELAIIIGKKCYQTSVEDAKEYILGFTILNDVSARIEQMADKQFFRSKSFDTFAPLGPWIVSSDEIGDPMNLKIECKVNGQIMQNSNTQNMNFNIYEIVSFISEAITLLPGDIIGTGTPAGVGAGKNPPQSLKSGNLVELTIENIGSLRNRVQ
jgi:2-keto-4-pentenoate hydratase/2-oxohepta-3-ene-1,7-dioic acid hydratase in catechol pathway